MTRRSENERINSGAALVPLIVDVVIDAAGPLRNVRWRPGPETNLVRADPGCGATSLWRELAKEGRHVDIAFTPVSIPGLGGNFALPAGIRALATAAAAITAATPRYCPILDTDVTVPLDDEALADLCRLLEVFRGQSIVFCSPAIFQRLAGLRADRWQLTREYGQSRLINWHSRG